MNLEQWLASLPGIFWICLLTPVSFAIVGCFLARQWIKPHKRNSHHDIAHATLGPIATIFGILGGAFIVATTWNQYNTTRINLNEESNALRDLYYNTQALTPTACSNIQQLCRDYRKAVVTNEWKIVIKGKDDLVGDTIIRKLSDLYHSYTLTSDKEKIFFQLSVDHLEKLIQCREQRIEDSCTGLLPLLWILFLLGATTLISVSLLMISSPAHTHGAMSILLSAMIGVMIFTIISLDYPFIGMNKLQTTPLDMIPMEKKT
jgi:hypothetical protein